MFPSSTGHVLKYLNLRSYYKFKLEIMFYSCLLKCFMYFCSKFEIFAVLKIDVYVQLLASCNLLSCV